jgi:hypothetical protein
MNFVLSLYTILPAHVIQTNLGFPRFPNFLQIFNLRKPFSGWKRQPEERNERFPAAPDKITRDPSMRDPLSDLES